jgi:allophanate hydrolase subunit 2
LDHPEGGRSGGRLYSGQHLQIASASCLEEREGDILSPVSANPKGNARVTMGPQQRFFSAETLATFLSGDWRITDAGDRMGVRLAGPLIPPAAALDMPSEPIVRGSIQVNGDGVATVLLADHQTTGGYPKIATVLDCDLDAFVQLRTGDPVVFRPVSSPGAISAARAAHLQSAAYQAALASPHGTLANRLMSENLIAGVFDASPYKLSDERA